MATAARCRQVLRDLVRPQRVTAATGLLILVVATAVGLLVPPLLGRIVGLVAGHRPGSELIPPAAGIALAALVSGTLTPIGLTRLATAGETALAELRERFVQRALLLAPGRIEEVGSGDLTARVTTDVARIGEAVQVAVPEFVRAGLTIGLTLVAVTVLDWRFLVAAALALPVQVSAVRSYLRRAGQVYEAERAAAGQQQQHLLETIGGAATIRAFRLTDRHLPRVAMASSRRIERTLDGITLQTTFAARLNLAEFIGLAGVLVIGFGLVRDGAVSLGTACAAVFWFYGLFSPVRVVLFLLDEAQSAAAGLARLIGVADLPEPERMPLDQAPLDQAPLDQAPLDQAPADRPSAPVAVVVDRVDHAYRSGHPVLAGIDLEIPAGQRIAVVGASGTGKTTLARLIAGVQAPTRGAVRIDGTDIAELGPGRLRRRVALITQEVHVFAGPLSEDLRLARPEATDEQLLAALEQVQALGWVRSLPDGPDTVVGAGGHPLTAAQAQQLALARLVLADPPVAVLDEATAEAGSAGARVLEQAADRALAGRTAVVVAHRLPQAVSADRIIVLDGGRIAEQGDHAELLAADGIYARLWRAWSQEDRPTD